MNTEFYKHICRVLPLYVAKNHEYFELLSEPKIMPKNPKAYTLRIKQKITCMKREFLI